MSSSARNAVLLPAPESPVTMTMSMGSLTTHDVSRQGERARVLLDEVGAPPPRPGLCDGLVQVVLELARRVVAHELQELVARRHLDDGGHVAARAHRDVEERQLLVEHGVDLFVDAEAVVLGVLVPVA